MGQRSKQVILAALSVGLFGAVFALTPWGVAMDRNIGLGWLYVLRGPVSPPPDVVVVGMSRRSVDRLGLPSDLGKWPRALHAQLIRRLTKENAAVIVCDIFFRNNREPATDRELASAIASSARTVLFQRVERDRAFVDRSDTETAVTDQLLSPARIFAQAATGLGPFPLPKLPARVDQFWTFSPTAGHAPTLPVVALQVLALRSLADPEKVLARLDRESAAHLHAYLTSTRTNEDLGKFMRRFWQANRKQAPSAGLAPLLNRGRGTSASNSGTNIGWGVLQKIYSDTNSKFINYYGPPGTIPTIPYHEIIGNEEKNRNYPDISGKVVFVGLSDFTSTDGKDGFHTVFSRKDGIQLSGVEILATAFGNLLHGDTLLHLGSIDTFLAVFAFGAVVTAVAILLEGYVAIVASIILAAVALGSGLFAFANHNLWLPLTVPLIVQLPLALLLGSITGYLWFRQSSERLRTRVGSFLPESIVRFIASEASPEQVREIAYGISLFADLRGYTSFSEAHTPADLAVSTSQYYGLIDRAVEGRDNRGEVLRHSGDGTIALWDDRKFATRDAMRRAACRAALEIRDAVARTGNDPVSLQLPVTIGLYEGEYLHGMLGEEGHLEHTALGDTINTAARIEGLNRRLGTTVLVSTLIANGLDDEFLFRPLGKFRLVGKSDSVELCEVLEWRNRSTPWERDLAERFALLRDRVEFGRCEEAAVIADQILARYPEDGPARFFKAYAEQDMQSGNSEYGSPIVMTEK